MKAGGRYGARKLWHQLRREGRDIARCTVERLMKAVGVQGIVRGKKVITTNPDAAQPCPDDKVNRAFVADMPDRLWVSDFTYVSSLARDGVCCLCHRRLRPEDRRRARLDFDDHQLRARRREPSHLPAGAVPDGQADPYHSDRGSQYLSIRYTQRLAEAGVNTSVGSVGDSDDKAFAKSIIGLFKTEVIKFLGPWKSVGQVEWETLKWVDWYNKTRLHSAIGYVTPNEAEEEFYTSLNAAAKAA